MADTSSKITSNRLYIPKIDINLPYTTGDETAMLTGAWWRSPSSGNPRDGGNFVLSAHRFIMSWTPGETVKRSPFYTIDKLSVGDSIVVDYSGKRYIYIIDKTYSVAPTATEIEAPTSDARLTLYSCGLGGVNDRRDVIIAKLKKD
jgi:sortase A